MVIIVARYIDPPLARIGALLWGARWQRAFPDAQQCLKFTQIASEGGLLSAPVARNFI